MIRLAKHSTLLRRFFSEAEKIIPYEEVTLNEANKIRSKHILPSKEELVFPTPESDSFEYSIRGKEFHAVDILLKPNQAINTRAGSLAYMNHLVDFSTVLHGGIATSLNRSIAGSSVFLIQYSNKSSEENASLMLSPTHPSKIIPIDLKNYGGKLLCHRDSYLCGDTNIIVTASYISNPIFGFWGGEGFALQQIEGSGVGLISGGGVIVKKTLKIGEEIRLSPGSILAFDSNIEYKMLSISGIKNILFGQGLFFLLLKGPGDVYIQTMPFQKIAKNMVSTLQKYLPTKPNS